MRYTVDRIKPNFAYSDQRGLSPAVRDTITNMTGSLGYQLTWQGDKTVPLFGKNRLRWWLNSIDVSTSATRQTVTRWSLRNGVFQKDPYRYSATIRNQGNMRYNPFRSLESSFGMVVNRDAAVPHDWYGIDVGTEVGRTNNLRLFFDVPNTWRLIKHLDPSFEVQSNYAEDSSPSARREGDPIGTRNVNAQRNDTARLKFDFSKHMTSLFTALGWDPVVTEPPRVAAPADTSLPDSLKTAGKERPGAGTLFKGVGRMFTRFQPIIGNVQHRSSSNYSRIPARPDLDYRLGFTTDSGVISQGEELNTPDQKREEWSYNMNSSVRLLEKSDGQTLDLQARYTASTSESDFRANQQRTFSHTWPDLQLKWDNLHEFTPLSPILADGEFTIDYRKASSESGIRDEPPTTETSNFSFTPGLLFLWKNELTSTLKVAIAENSSETRGSRSTTNNLSVNLDLKKNFRAGGGFNFFGKEVKWTNELESNLAISYTKSSGERFLPGANIAEPIPATTNIRVAPNVRYFFNRNVNGSAFLDYTRSYAEALGQTITTLRLGITALINF
jgi:hypothetical protein